MSRKLPKVAEQEMKTTQSYEVCQRCNVLLRKAIWHNSTKDQVGYWEQLTEPITLLLGLEHICDVAY